jgi:hypothetical protein
MKQFHLFIFFRFISILSHLTTVTGRLYFIVDTYVKSRENPEHQYRLILVTNLITLYVCLIGCHMIYTDFPLTNINDLVRPP